MTRRDADGGDLAENGVTATHDVRSPPGQSRRAQRRTPIEGYDMTEKTIASKSNGEPAKMPGWFSWRHQSSEQHETARERYLAEHGIVARRRKAVERSTHAIDVQRWKCGHRSTSANHPCTVTA